MVCRANAIVFCTYWSLYLPFYLIGLLMCRYLLLMVSMTTHQLNKKNNQIDVKTAANCVLYTAGPSTSGATHCKKNVKKYAIPKQTKITAWSSLDSCSDLQQKAMYSVHTHTHTHTHARTHAHAHAHHTLTQRNYTA